MRRVLIASGTLIAVFVLLMSPLLVVHLVKLPYGILTPGPCQQPCWHGLLFDKTSVDDAEAILRTDPMIKDVTRLAPTDDFPCVLTWSMDTLPGWQGCAYAPFGNHGNPIGFVRLMARPDNQQLELADVLATIGMPDKIQVCHISSYWLIILHNDRFKLVGRALNYRPTSAFTLNLYSITLPYIYTGFESEEKRWAGFKDWQRYQTSTPC